MKELIANLSVQIVSKKNRPTFAKQVSVTQIIFSLSLNRLREMNICYTEGNAMVLMPEWTNENN